MGRKGIVMLAVVACIAFSVVPSAATPQTGDPSASPLVVETSPATELSASFSRSTSFVTLRSTTTAAGETGTTVTLGRKTFTATRDGSDGSASWSGNGAVLTPSDQDAITSMLVATEQQVAGRLASANAAVPDNVDLALRLLMLLAEAPAGVKIGTYDAPQPTTRVERPGDLAGPAPVRDERTCIVDATKTTPEGSEARAVALAACQASDEDGIYYMACTEGTRTLSHDSNGHCFLSERINSGPGSSQCMGECGPGCNGINAYTYDCGDHDRCGRVHGGSTNPWDAECGDEYWEADDDFLWAEINRC